jgi:hypothetical protein
MFCPGCGLEERHSNQFCRACGTDLRQVRLVLERPDKITASAVSARDEIGRALAARIREAQTVKELENVAEDVLPAIEKFLESPEEKRMRRVRRGVITASIGVGAAITFFYASLLMIDRGILLIAGAGALTFFIGLSFIINALFFTVPRKSLPDKSTDAQSQRALDRTDAATNELLLPESNNVFSSVTEHTTRHLKEKQSIPRR